MTAHLVGLGALPRRRFKAMEYVSDPLSLRFIGVCSGRNNLAQIRVSVPYGGAGEPVHGQI